MVPGAGLEPARHKGQGILNPQRITNFATRAVGGGLLNFTLRFTAVGTINV